MSAAVAKGIDFGSHFRNHFCTRSVEIVVYMPFEKHAVAAVLVVFWTQDALLEPKRRHKGEPKTASKIEPVFSSLETPLDSFWNRFVVPASAADP